MQTPSTPWSTMQSITRRMPAMSSAPSSVKGVGATGQIPLKVRVVIGRAPPAMALESVMRPPGIRACRRC